MTSGTEAMRIDATSVRTEQFRDNLHLVDELINEQKEKIRSYVTQIRAIEEKLSASLPDNINSQIEALKKNKEAHKLNMAKIRKDLSRIEKISRKFETEGLLSNPEIKSSIELQRADLVSDIEVVERQITYIDQDMLDMVELWKLSLENSRDELLQQKTRSQSLLMELVQIRSALDTKAELIHNLVSDRSEANKYKANTSIDALMRYAKHVKRENQVARRYENTLGKEGESDDLIQVVINEYNRRVSHLESTLESFYSSDIQQTEDSSIKNSSNSLEGFDNQTSSQKNEVDEAPDYSNQGKDVNFSEAPTASSEVSNSSIGQSTVEDGSPDSSDSNEDSINIKNDATNNSIQNAVPAVDYSRSMRSALDIATKATTESIVDQGGGEIAPTPTPENSGLSEAIPQVEKKPLSRGQLAHKLASLFNNSYDLSRAQAPDWMSLNGENVLRDVQQTLGMAEPLTPDQLNFLLSEAETREKDEQHEYHPTQIRINENLYDYVARILGITKKSDSQAGGALPLTPEKPVEPTQPAEPKRDKNADAIQAINNEISLLQGQQYDAYGSPAYMGGAEKERKIFELLNKRAQLTGEKNSTPTSQPVKPEDKPTTERKGFWSRLFGRQNKPEQPNTPAPEPQPQPESQDELKQVNERLTELRERMLQEVAIINNRGTQFGVDGLEAVIRSYSRVLNIATDLGEEPPRDVVLYVPRFANGRLEVAGQFPRDLASNLASCLAELRAHNNGAIPLANASEATRDGIRASANMLFANRYSNQLGIRGIIASNI